jgi:hypothetical protein
MTNVDCAPKVLGKGAIEAVVVELVVVVVTLVRPEYRINVPPES